MLETKMHWITYVILLPQIMVLFFQIINCLIKPNDLSQKRFLVLILIFINYNFFSGIYNINQFTISFPDLIIYVLGGILFMYGSYYINKEFQIKYSYTIRQTLIGFLFVFIILLGLPYLTTINFNFPLQFLISSLILWTLFFTFNNLKGLAHLYKTTLKEEESAQVYFKARIISAGILVICLQVIPFSFFIKGFQNIKQSLVNTGFFIMVFVYLKNYINQRIKEDALLTSLIKFENDMKEKKSLKILT